MADGRSGSTILRSDTGRRALCLSLSTRTLCPKPTEGLRGSKPSPSSRCGSHFASALQLRSTGFEVRATSTVRSGTTVVVDVRKQESDSLANLAAMCPRQSKKASGAEPALSCRKDFQGRSGAQRRGLLCTFEAGFVVQKNCEPRDPGVQSSRSGRRSFSVDRGQKTIRNGSAWAAGRLASWDRNGGPVPGLGRHRPSGPLRRVESTSATRRAKEGEDGLMGPATSRPWRWLERRANTPGVDRSLQGRPCYISSPMSHKVGLLRSSSLTHGILGSGRHPTSRALPGTPPFLDTEGTIHQVSLRTIPRGPTDRRPADQEPTFGQVAE